MNESRELMESWLPYDLHSEDNSQLSCLLPFTLIRQEGYQNLSHQNFWTDGIGKAHFTLRICVNYPFNSIPCVHRTFSSTEEYKGWSVGKQLFKCRIFFRNYSRYPNPEQ